LGGLAISYEGVELKYDSHEQQATSRRLDDELRDVLLEVGDLCARSDRKGVILRYDEFHVVEEKRGTTTISALLSAVATAQQRGLPVMLILCGLPPIVEHLVQAKSYSERMFTPERLANLGPAEASAALIEQAKENRLSDLVWPQVASALAGSQYQFVGQASDDGIARINLGPGLQMYHTRSGNQRFYNTPLPADWSEDQLNQRRQLIGQLLAVNNTPAAVEALHRALSMLAAKTMVN